MVARDQRRPWPLRDREANGALSFKELDYESDLGLGPDKAYTVTVQATEQDDGEPLTLELTGDLAVTVTITNVNEPPVVRRSSGTGAFSIEENSGTWAASTRRTRRGGA